MNVYRLLALEIILAPIHAGVQPFYETPLCKVYASLRMMAKELYCPMGHIRKADIHVKVI